MPLRGSTSGLISYSKSGVSIQVGRVPLHGTDRFEEMGVTIVCMPDRIVLAKGWQKVPDACSALVPVIISYQLAMKETKENFRIYPTCVANRLLCFRSCPTVQCALPNGGYFELAGTDPGTAAHLTTSC